MHLFHYYDKDIGPFVNLSDLPINEAVEVLNTIKQAKPSAQSAKRHPTYVDDRHYYEAILRKEFTRKKVIIKRTAPHYMVVEHSPWLSTWFENSAYVKIPISDFDLGTISFTYGDSHPVFSPRPNSIDGKEYRKTLYTYAEILTLIDKYGLPQLWNDDGKFGPERYIEAHVWCDEIIGKYRQA
ncbi:MAG: hypothetical protein FWC92_11560 [Defluviitaleaceae bacterium]|nr:hypothetical protein [Defluviitaleaceae bacterium]